MASWSADFCQKPAHRTSSESELSSNDSSSDDITHSSFFAAVPAAVSGIPFRFERNLQRQPVKQWTVERVTIAIGNTHGSPSSLKRSKGVKLNGILECKNRSDTNTDTNTAPISVRQPMHCLQRLDMIYGGNDKSSELSRGMLLVTRMIA
jgi:hypothetical protein